VNSGIREIESLQHLATSKRRKMLLNEALMMSNRARNSSEKPIGLLVSNSLKRNPKGKLKPLQLLKAE
jgi:hypothetical protein